MLGDISSQIESGREGREGFGVDRSVLFLLYADMRSLGSSNAIYSERQNNLSFTIALGLKY